jgi:2-keto-4-pentenoate hydratase
MSAWEDPRVQKGLLAQLANRRARMDAGGVPIGWKIGFGAPAAMEKLKISGPLIGFLMQEALVPSGAVTSLKGWCKPVAEPEIAVYFGATLPAGASHDDARKAVAALGPAIELADLDHPTDDVEGILTRDIFQRHVVLGPRDPSRAGIRLDNLVGRVTRSGRNVEAPSDLETNIGKITDLVRYVANVLGAFGEALRPGDLLITGSVTPPLFLEHDERDVSFTLDPVGSASVCFAHS